MSTTTKATIGGKVYVSYVDEWLDSLPAADAEDFREFAEYTPSIIEIWVYAGICITLVHSTISLVGSR